MQFKSENIIKAILLISFGFIFTACTQSDPNGFYDPLEKINRKTHSFNKSLDKILLRPASKVYGVVVSDFADILINNFTNNLSEPSNAANHLLQGKLKKSSNSTARFLVNTTIGIGGITDPASRLGISSSESDFGKTLHAWGFNEGAYVELPFYAASTVRDTTGIVVDFVMDPINSIIPSKYKPHTQGAKLIELAGDRNEYGEIIDNMLYKNEDSYASQRLYYLQRRRFDLNNNTISDDDLGNPYEDE
ncbi:VacJ family lipoprotein [Amylibacter sp.]|nr:VacJ family lipoprotein [Amylibacter sp.]